MKYDYLIIGAGLYGAVCAFELKKLGKSVLVIDKRNHKGGNVYCENIEGINVHNMELTYSIQMMRSSGVM